MSDSRSMPPTSTLSNRRLWVAFALVIPFGMLLGVAQHWLGMSDRSAAWFLVTPFVTVYVVVALLWVRP